MGLNDQGNDQGFENILEVMDKSNENSPYKVKQRYMWAMLLARIFEVLPLLCSRCSKPMRIISFIPDPKIITKILDHVGESSTPPPIKPAKEISGLIEVRLISMISLISKKILNVQLIFLPYSNIRRMYTLTALENELIARTSYKVKDKQL